MIPKKNPMDFPVPTALCYTSLDMDHSYHPHAGEFKTSEIALGWILGASVLSSVNASLGQAHRHPYTELIFCLKGEFVYSINKRHPVTLKSGLGILVPANTNHPLRGGLIQPGFRIVIHLAPSPRESKHSAFAHSDITNILGLLSKSANRPFAVNRAIQANLKEVAAIITSPPNERSALDLCHFRILCEDILFRCARLQEKPFKELEPSLMNDAVDFIETHYAEKLQIDKIVEKIGYSRARLFDLFRDHTGLTPHEYLLRFRIKKAKELMQKDGLSVKDAAVTVGFKDYSYFSTVYKRYMGQSAQKSLEIQKS